MLKKKLEGLLLVADKLSWQDLKELCEEVKYNIITESEDDDTEYRKIKSLINNIVFQWYYRNTDTFKITNGGFEYDYSNFIIVKEGTNLEEIENLVNNNFSEFVGFIVGTNEEWGFSDEYTVCDKCNTLLPLSGLSCWTRNFEIRDNGNYCKECYDKINNSK